MQKGAGTILTNSFPHLALFTGSPEAPEKESLPDFKVYYSGGKI
jgi:hypothetical protein